MLSKVCLNSLIVFGLTFSSSQTWAINDLASQAQMVLRQAYQEALHIPKPRPQAEVLRYISEVQARTEDLMGALVTIQKIPDLPEKNDSVTSKKNDAVWAVVRARAEKGDIEGARKAFTKFRNPHPHKHDHALGSIAAAQARNGDLSGALETIIPIKDKKNKASVLSRIVEGYALSGNLVEAEKMAFQIADDYFRDKGKALLASVYARRGKFPAALQLASTIQVLEHKDQALWDIALFQATARDFHGAEHTATQMQADKWARYNALIDIAEIHARAGHPTEARQLAINYAEDWEQAVGLQSIARVQFINGDKKEAQETLNLAFRTARSAKGDRDYALLHCVIAQAVLGDIKGALRNAASLPNEELRHDHPIRQRALVGIAKVQAAMGDATGVFQTVHSILTDARRTFTKDRFIVDLVIQDISSQMWKEIARAQAEAGDDTGALESVKQLTEPRVKANTLLGIGEGLLKRMNSSTLPEKKDRFLFAM